MSLENTHMQIWEHIYIFLHSFHLSSCKFMWTFWYPTWKQRCQSQWICPTFITTQMWTGTDHQPGQHEPRWAADAPIIHPAWICNKAKRDMAMQKWGEMTDHWCSCGSLNLSLMHLFCPFNNLWLHDKLSAYLCQALARVSRSDVKLSGFRVYPGVWGFFSCSLRLGANCWLRDKRYALKQLIIWLWEVLLSKV